MSKLSLTLRAFAGACAVAGSISCASPTSKPPVAPQGLAQQGAAPQPSASRPQEEPLTLSLLPAPQGVAPAPQSCQTRVAFAPPPCAAAQATDQNSHLQQLAQALQITNDLDRDRALAQLEECSEFAPGLLRSLRAELGPANCADVLANDYFSAHKNAPRPDLKDLLFGLGIAARLDRVDLSPPVDFSAADSKEHFMQLFKEQLTPWIVRQAKAIQELMEQAAALHGYGRGVGAIAAGIADLRFVELTRALPLPKEMAADAELKDAYYGALDQALEPRKERGRDAALVGMKELAAVGVLRSERLTQARRLLSSQYAGRRVDLLDGLLLGPVPSADGNPAQSAAFTTLLLQKLPTYYTTEILAQVDLSSPAALRALFDQGLPQRYRTALHGAAQGQAEREVFAPLLFDLGRTYWRAEDFVQTAEVASVVAPKGPAPSESLQLLSALAQALQQGPKSVAEMMLKGPFLQGSPQVEALDALAKKKGPLAGLAAYDAALLLSLNPPVEGAQSFWQQMEKRYKNAASLLKDPTQKKEASARAQAAADTAKAVH